MALIDLQREPDQSWPVSLWLGVRIALAFLLLAPALTQTLLWLKGYPEFPGTDWANGLPWVYRMLWAPSLLAGLITGGLALAATRLTAYFHHPYEWGRPLSLGAISGAAAQVLGVMIQHLLAGSTGQPHPFWLATAAITGCLCGSLILPLAIWKFTRPSAWEQSPRWLAAAVAAAAIAFALAARLNYRIFAANLLSDDLARRSTAQTLVLHSSTRPACLAEALKQPLRAADAERRLRALEQLARLGPRAAGARRAVEARLQDPDPEVRRQAVVTLSLIE